MSDSITLKDLFKILEFGARFYIFEYNYDKSCIGQEIFHGNYKDFEKLNNKENEKLLDRQVKVLQTDIKMEFRIVLK